MGNRGLFLDRDGVLNQDFGYVYSPNDLVLVENVLSELSKVVTAFDHIFVVSNQSGVGRGYYTKDDVYLFQEKLNLKLLSYDITIDEWCYCFHTPEDACNCRKPNIAMLEYLLQKYSIDNRASCMIGDKLTDCIAAETAGIGQIILFTDNKVKQSEFDIANSWSQVKKILSGQIN